MARIHTITNKPSARARRPQSLGIFGAMVLFLGLSIASVGMFNGILFAGALPWTPLPSHTVRVFYSVVHDNPVETFEITVGTAFEFIPDNPPEAGHVMINGIPVLFYFDGWFTDPDATDESTRFDIGKAITEDIDLFARWRMRLPTPQNPA